LVGTQRSFCEACQLPRRAVHQIGQRRCGATDQDRADRARPLTVTLECRDRPALPDRREQRASRPIAAVRDPQWTPGQRERVALPRAVVEPEPGDRQDVRRARVQEKGVLQVDRADRPALRAEPALVRDRPAIESPQRLGDFPERWSAGTRWTAQILSITCLTTV
jgi:hypothetical protein